MEIPLHTWLSLFIMVPYALLNFLDYSPHRGRYKLTFFISDFTELMTHWRVVVHLMILDMILGMIIKSLKFKAFFYFVYMIDLVVGSDTSYFIILFMIEILNFKIIFDLVNLVNLAGLEITSAEACWTWLNKAEK